MVHDLRYVWTKKFYRYVLNNTHYRAVNDIHGMELQVALSRHDMPIFKSLATRIFQLWSIQLVKVLITNIDVASLACYGKLCT